MEGSSLAEHHKDLTAGAGGGEEQEQAQGQTHPLDTSAMRAWLGKVFTLIVKFLFGLQPAQGVYRS